ncbi:unnamed protein product [Closterium sp. NIES-53]
MPRDNSQSSADAGGPVGACCEGRGRPHQPISHQPSAISHQPISHQPSAISHQPSAISPSAHQPSAISQSANQPISPSAHQPISPSAHQPISPSAHQPINQSAHQPISPSTQVPFPTLPLPPLLHSKLHMELLYRPVDENGVLLVPSAVESPQNIPPLSMLPTPLSQLHLELLYRPVDENGLLYRPVDENGLLLAPAYFTPPAPKTLQEATAAANAAEARKTRQAGVGFLSPIKAQQQEEGEGGGDVPAMALGGDLGGVGVEDGETKYMRGVLQVALLSGRELMACDMNGLSDPFAVLEVSMLLLCSEAAAGMEGEEVACGKENPLSHMISALPRLASSRPLCAPTAVAAGRAEGEVTGEVTSLTAFSNDLCSLTPISPNRFARLQLQLGGQRRKSRVVKKTLEPEWNENFEFLVEDGKHDMLVVALFDHDLLGKKVGLSHQEGLAVRSRVKLQQPTLRCALRHCAATGGGWQARHAAGGGAVRPRPAGQRAVSSLVEDGKHDMLVVGLFDRDLLGKKVGFPCIDGKHGMLVVWLYDRDLLGKKVAVACNDLQFVCMLGMK